MAEVITSGKVIQKPEIVLDKDDFLPPGIQGVRTETREEAGPPGGMYSADSSTITPDVIGDEDGDGIDDDDELPDGEGGPTEHDFGHLPVPQDMTIVSQTLRVHGDGKITVDVVIETSDFPGITEFEVKITKDIV